MKRFQNILILLLGFVAGVALTLGLGWSTKVLSFSTRTEAVMSKTFDQMVS